MPIDFDRLWWFSTKELDRRDLTLPETVELHLSSYYLQPLHFVLSCTEHSAHENAAGFG